MNHRLAVLIREETGPDDRARWDRFDARLWQLLVVVEDAPPSEPAEVPADPHKQRG